MALLDNLSYRLDQNGPFNSVFAVKNIALSSIAPNAVYTGAKVIPSGVQPNLKTPTVESWLEGGAAAFRQCFVRR
jgi:hypothetical protein